MFSLNILNKDLVLPLFLETSRPIFRYHLPCFPRVAMNDEIESFEWTNGGLYLEPHEKYVDSLI